ncbi:Glycosyltransferase involved in cell wall bisynthesis [Flavobacterium resistens]|uniref:Glycosyltransferase n=1 Tax=Flavobacterium resistens TaxID=443612 RepID=A0A521DTW4_9FLAO|nr:glycosyltransferase [Flavobacterium resistens]MRX68169.1 glycosyltransferase [Flavobacterium resistens]SMO75075.1 Glycosyltransferase involved in cell wall bisynthesis [Flavobacterium resistens]
MTNNAVKNNINKDNDAELAIVIPAYKETYLHEALSSIVNQTHKGFTVYIGDDNSPFNIYEIVKEFEDEINIVYKRFDQNIGGKDLVAQWHRCIDMIQDEKWIWLFSDDDVMEANCVEQFYKNKLKYDDQLFHFNVKVIDSKSNDLYNVNEFPAVLHSPDLIDLKMRGKLCSYVVEYIFSRDLYETKGKFEYFDLAWGSDDATWIKFLGTKQLRTIENTFVKWRYSESNISSSNGDINFVYRKINASLSYLSWLQFFFKENGLIDKTSIYIKIKWLLEVVKISKLTVLQRINLTFYVCKELRSGILLKYFFLFFMIYSIVKINCKIQIFKIRRYFQ